MIAVIGATGTIGRRVVAQLAQGGHRFRAVVRDEARATRLLGTAVRTVPGDLAHPETLGDGLRGASGMFLLVPDGPGDAKLVLEANAIEAARLANVEHVVYLSAPGRGREPEFAFARLHHRTERLIEQSGLAWTQLRPISFMSNLLLSLESIRTQSAFYLPTGDGKVSSIDPDDVAAVAVEALTGTGHEGKAFTLTGPQALSHDEQAELVSGVLGRTVNYVDVSEAVARQAMLTAGLPSDLVEDLLEFYALVRAGERALVTDEFEKVTGRKPATFAEFCERNAEAFR